MEQQVLERRPEVRDFQHIVRLENVQKTFGGTAPQMPVAVQPNNAISALN